MLLLYRTLSNTITFFYWAEEITKTHEKHQQTTRWKTAEKHMPLRANNGDSIWHHGYLHSAEQPKKKVEDRESHMAKCSQTLRQRALDTTFSHQVESTFEYTRNLWKMPWSEILLDGKNAIEPRRTLAIALWWRDCRCDKYQLRYQTCSLKVLLACPKESIFNRLWKDKLTVAIHCVLVLWVGLASHNCSKWRSHSLFNGKGCHSIVTQAIVAHKFC